jgi:hypothetical protein
MNQLVDLRVPANGERVIAGLNYLVPGPAKPYAYTYPPPAGEPERSGAYVSQAMPIHDGRVAGPFSLDLQGFALRAHRSAVTDFSDHDAVRARYYPEVEQLLKEETGADAVLAFDHNVRSAPKENAGVAGIRSPVLRVHNDFTYRSAPERLRRLLPPAQAERRLAARFAFVNLWRPIAEPVEDSPLALCDARSIDPQDLIATDLRYRDRTGEVYSVAANPGHRWFYFPHMRRDEVVLLKCYDSATDGRARLTAHSAFVNPAAPAGAAPRESIEVRTVIFFPPS